MDAGSDVEARFHDNRPFLQTSEHHTSTAEHLGTHGFRAPECEGYNQWSQDPRTDLYSAAKVLWAMVTNDPGFTREEVVFNQLSLVFWLKDAPMTWHFQRIFEKSIRHSLSDRYRNADEAIKDALFVREAIVGRFPPLEMLATEICPICGTGTLGQFSDKNDEALCEQFFENLSLRKRQGALVCSYCYHVSIRNQALLEKRLERRKQMR